MRFLMRDKVLIEKKKQKLIELTVGFCDAYLDDSDRWELVGSDVIDFEISKIPDKERKKKVELLAQKISKKQQITTELIQRAKIIEQKGIKPLDALHIASAELLQSDYIITTDNEIVKNYQKHIEFFEKIKIYNPILFLTEVL